MLINQNLNRALAFVASLLSRHSIHEPEFNFQSLLKLIKCSIKSYKLTYTFSNYQTIALIKRNKEGLKPFGYRKYVDQDRHFCLIRNTRKWYLIAWPTRKHTLLTSTCKSICCQLLTQDAKQKMTIYPQTNDIFVNTLANVASLGIGNSQSIYSHENEAF